MSVVVYVILVELVFVTAKIVLVFLTYFRKLGSEEIVLVSVLVN